MSKHKALFGLVATVAVCMSLILSPIAARAVSPGSGLTLSVTPNVLTASLGENVSYSFVIISTSNGTIDSLVLTDDRLGAISLPSTSIAPGENITAVAVHTVVAADFPGPILASATVAGASAIGDNYTATASCSVALNPLASSVEVSVSSDRASASVGDNITYDYTVVNTGQSDLTGIVLTDSRLGVIALSAAALAPKASATGSAVYKVLTSDLPGPLATSATVMATSAAGGSVTATASTTVALEVFTGSLKVSMNASKRNAVPGDNITYTYMVVNMGQGALTGIVLTDSKLGVVALSSSSLAPQAKATGSAIYTVLTSDLPGPLTSRASVTAVDASGKALTARSSTVSVRLATEGDDDSRETKGEIHRDRGVPGKGIDHAPGQQKFFNWNWGWDAHGKNGNSVSDNNSNSHDNGKGNSGGKGNDSGKGNGSGNGNSNQNHSNNGEDD
jgi:hypothetical protein